MTTSTTTAPQLNTGQLVAQSVNGTCATVLSAKELDDASLSTDLTVAGWRFARFDGTGALVLVRLTGDRRWVAAWNTWAVLVEVAEVGTGVGQFNGRPSVVVTLGELRGGRRWLARLDRLV